MNNCISYHPSSNHDTKLTQPNNNTHDDRQSENKNDIKNVSQLHLSCSRPGGGGVGSSITGNINNAANQMRNQINQQIGQAVTNAAMSELSNVFSRKLK